MWENTNEFQEIMNYRKESKIGVLHIGLGTFHRTHQADYFHELHKKGLGGDWGIFSVNIRSGKKIVDRLKEQNCLYSLVEKGENVTRYKAIGSIFETFYYPEDPYLFFEKVMCYAIKLVTLTVTEKGYYFNTSQNSLEFEHPDIIHDLQSEYPKTAIGIISKILNLRNVNKVNLGLTVLSCDNMSHNGRVLKEAIFQFMNVKYPGIYEQVVKYVSFPSSMVDRISPEMTPTILEEVMKDIGHLDVNAVWCEPFKQWVIEENFAGEIPKFSEVGAEVVEDVELYETMKLRMLNGSHSIMAYLGVMLGYNYINTVMDDSFMKTLVEYYLEKEVIPTIDKISIETLRTYKDKLIERFSNANLHHKTYQIAMDGSKKIPVRWLPVMRDLLKNGLECKVLPLAIASWIIYMKGTTLEGKLFEVQDPYKENASVIYSKCLSDSEIVMSFLEEESIFGSELCNNKIITSSIEHHMKMILKNGLRRTIDEFVKLNKE